MKKEKIALTLEGGAGKGSFHVGVWEALRDQKKEIIAVCGTSVGAIIGAFIATDEYDKMMDFIEGFNVEKVFGINKKDYNDIISGKFDFKTSMKAIKILFKGIDISLLRNYLEEFIDEDKVRNSKRNYGLVTFSTREVKAYEVFIKDIPKGKLLDYIVGSCALPIFRYKDNNEKFIDGAIINNLPTDLLIKNGYDNIIESRLNTFFIGSNRSLKSKYKDINIRVIKSKHINSMFDVTKKSISENINRGYYETYRTFYNLYGEDYYFDECKKSIIKDSMVVNPALLKQYLIKLDKQKYIGNYSYIFEKIIPKLRKKLDLNYKADYDIIYIKLLEQVAKGYNIDEFKIYTIKNLKKIIIDNIKLKNKYSGDVEYLEILKLFL